MKEKLVNFERYFNLFLNMLSEKLNCNQLISFISEHQHSNPADLLMRYSNKDLDFDIKFAITQINNRQKCAKKLKSFLSNKHFLFPDLISSEQATDERVALFHASLIGSNKKVMDLTSGLGIDAMTISLNQNEVTAVEIDELKSEILEYNATTLGISNFHVLNKNCLEVVNNRDISSFDIFFIDPARRDESKNRTYAFSDCMPDITSFYRMLIQHDATLFIKASPLLDIDAVKKQFECINHIYVVSVKGECKEVLIELKKGENAVEAITAIDLNDSGIKSQFTIEASNRDKFQKVETAKTEDLKENSYLYEPNSSVMKLNCGAELCKKFEGMKKISQNTELFISHKLYPDFPGRIIHISKILSSRDLKFLKGEGRSVVTRNYPIKAEELKKKLKVKEDPDNFVYGFKLGEKGIPVLIDGKKIGV